LPKVLLIDDDAISREVVTVTLEVYGFPVESAEDGSKALALLEDWSDNSLDSLPGIILMDTQMPGVSGLELIEKMRPFSTARVIAISGSDPGEAIRKATCGFLLKPIRAEDLVRVLESDGSVHHSAKIVAIEAEAGPKSGISHVIDPAVLGKLKAMMPAKAVEEIYAAVAADLKTRLPTLEAAMHSGDGGEVKRIAHAIKGGCAMVGLSGAMEAGSRLETGNLSETWPKELSRLQLALSALQGILGGGLPW
jgi:CheY-like chemotaxis protein